MIEYEARVTGFDGRDAILTVGYERRTVYCPLHILPYGVEIGDSLTLYYDGRQLVTAKRMAQPERRQ